MAPIGPTLPIPGLAKVPCQGPEQIETNRCLMILQRKNRKTSTLQLAINRNHILDDGWNGYWPLLVSPPSPSPVWQKFPASGLNKLKTTTRLMIFHKFNKKVTTTILTNHLNNRKNHILDDGWNKYWSVLLVPPPPSPHPHPRCGESSQPGGPNKLNKQQC